MKKLNYLTIILAGLVTMVACEDSVGPVINSNVENPTITAGNGGSFILNIDASDDTLTILEWSESDYGLDVAVTYTVQMAEEGSDFTDAMPLGTTNTNKFTMTGGELNATLLGADFIPEQEKIMDLRVRATVNEALDTMYTEPVSVTFTPYSNCMYCPAVYMPGSYQAASGYTNNWDPGTAPAINSVDGISDSYEGYVYMESASNEFKVTANRDWSLDWGITGGDNSTLYDGDGESNISLSSAGYYKINIDMNSLTLSTLNTSWGIIGSATPTGWDSDTDMTYDQSEKIWTINIDLIAGEIKFRANDDWALNYGDDGADGVLEQGANSNISVPEAGNYDVVLDLSEIPYTYSITLNQ